MSTLRTRLKQPKKVRVLFVCIGNACRSPMAEAIARQDAGDLLEVSSAGLFPLGIVPGMTRETLQRNGYSTKGLESKPISQDSLVNADLVINLSGHTKAAALSASAKIEDWLVFDPYGEEEGVYQVILEEIQRRITDLVARLRKERMKEKVDA